MGLVLNSLAKIPDVRVKADDILAVLIRRLVLNSLAKFLEVRARADDILAVSIRK